jgi:hypothetical protein
MGGAGRVVGKMDDMDDMDDMDVVDARLRRGRRNPGCVSRLSTRDEKL